MNGPLPLDEVFAARAALGRLDKSNVPERGIPSPGQQQSIVQSKDKSNEVTGKGAPEADRPDQAEAGDIGRIGIDEDIMPRKVYSDLGIRNSRHQERPLVGPGIIPGVLAVGHNVDPSGMTRIGQPRLHRRAGSRSPPPDGGSIRNRLGVNHASISW